MTKIELLQAAQSRAARSAVTASSVRGRGNKGVVPAARRFLRSLDLRSFGTKSARDFTILLARKTEALRRVLPQSAQRWGIARKVLNIFLRDCLYTVYLDRAYRLHRAERFLELPLDSITATQLKRATGRGMLPPWPGVKHLTPRLSASFQDAAARAAATMGIARVHLDALWWSVSRDEDAILET